MDLAFPILFAAGTKDFLIVAGILLAAGLLWGVPTILEWRSLKQLKESGTLMRAWIVQANDALYQKGMFNRPALLIASFPDAELSDPEMQMLAARLFDFHEVEPQTPAEKEAAGIVLDEAFQENAGGKLPLQFTAGKEVHWFHMRLDRSLLPDGILKDPFIQIRGSRSKAGELSCVMVSYASDSTTPFVSKPAAAAVAKAPVVQKPAPAAPKTVVAKKPGVVAEAKPSADKKPNTPVARRLPS